MYNAMHGHFAQNGVFVVPTVLSQVREERERKGKDGKSAGYMIFTILTVRFRFYASDGSYFDAVTAGEGSDTGDKSCNKAQSTAMKYALIQVFSLPTEGDNDTENHLHEVASRDKRRQPPAGVDPQTGEVTEQQPAEKPTPLSEEEARKALDAIEAACQAKNYPASFTHELIVKVCAKHGHDTLRAAGRAFAKKLIANIKSGMYDELVAKKGGAANAA